LKIAFDENVPIVLVKVFKVLANEGDILSSVIMSARDYAIPREQSDVPWMERFAADGGTVIISGDRGLRSKLHERQACRPGFHNVLFAPQWNNENPFVKSAILLKWWPKIQEQLGIAIPKQCFEIPFQWTGGELKEVTPPGARKKRPWRKKKLERT
jgi:hypothetical protein